MRPIRTIAYLAAALAAVLPSYAQMGTRTLRGYNGHDRSPGEGYHGRSQRAYGQLSSKYSRSVCLERKRHGTTHLDG
jgi:hypothetical protein